MSKGNHMKRTTLVFLTALFALVALEAQPISTFDLRPVIHTGMTIDGHSFAKDTRVYDAALNDGGEIAFSVRFDYGAGAVAIFTSRRMVASEADVIDGKVILLIEPDSPVAINNKGQVGWIGWYADEKEIAAGKESRLRAVFVDRHLVLNLFDESNDPFRLTDDGRVERFFGTEERSPDPAVSAQKKRGFLDRLKITGLKVPAGTSVSLGSDSDKGPAPSPGPKFRSPLENPLAGVPGNRIGQKLLAVNSPSGFLLILATPIKH
jgi:hypothetical protein